MFPFLFILRDKVGSPLVHLYLYVLKCIACNWPKVQSFQKLLVMCNNT